MTSAKVAKHDNIGFFESMDDKSHLSKNNHPEYSVGTAFQNRDNHSNPSAEDIVYNEAVMRGAFVQFLRRLADQVENGIIPLFDAMTFSPYNTISMNEGINHTRNTFKTSPPPPQTSPLPQSSSQPSLVPLLPTTPEEIQVHSGCHPMLQHHQERDTFHQKQQRKLLEQQQQRQHHQQHCEQQQHLQLPHHMSEMNDINLDDDVDDDEDDDDNDDDDDDVDGDANNIVNDDDRYNNDLIVGSAFSSESATLNSSGQFKQETSFQAEHISGEIFSEDSIKQQMVPLLSVVETSESDTYPDIIVDNLQLQILMDRVVNAKRPTSPVSKHYFSLSILQGAINLVFSKWELKHSSGLGLRRTKAESGYPLDRRKVEAIETFYLSLCDEYQLTKVSKAIFHKAFTIKISNAKRDHRKS